MLQRTKAKDCDSTCLRIISKHYGKSISLQHLRVTLFRIYLIV
ncbi:cysteine peptidase family C39 domain-containing protein [Chryseobacterium sp. MIQD13]